jgi:hypothetical protein
MKFNGSKFRGAAGWIWNLKELFGHANEFFDRQRAVSFIRRGLQRE